jgi:predicted acetyltransferase
MVRDFREAGDGWFATEQHLNGDDFAAYVEYLQKGAQGVDLPEGYVPWTAMWLVNTTTGQLLGVSSLRHRLTPTLEEIGGHIGYAIRPTQRGKGYGTAILSLSLEEAKKLGLTHVQVHCDVENIASARVIQKHGGRLLSQSKIESGITVCRYCIELH